MEKKKSIYVCIYFLTLKHSSILKEMTVKNNIKMPDWDVAIHSSLTVNYDKLLQVIK